MNPNQPQQILPNQANAMSGQTPAASAGQSDAPAGQQSVAMPGQNAIVSGQDTSAFEQNTATPDGQKMAMTGQNAMPQQIMPNNPQAQGIGSAAMAANQMMPVSPNKDNPLSTQSTLLISELRDNVVIMKDGSFRAVVACKSINFDLMSDVEREGVEYSYQNFLNSLTFTTQILVRSQRVDIGPYLSRLIEIRRNNDNLLLGVLMDDYINFIEILSQEANIMDKSFFVIVPYYTSAETEKGLQESKNFFKTFSRAKGPEVTRIDRATYDKAMTEINNRVDTITSGLFQIGIHSVRLNTKELAQLYYNFNNPDTAVREPLVDFSKVATMYVKKGEKECT